MNILHRKYLSSVAGICFDKPDDQGTKKTPQQLAADERAKIVTTQNKPEEKTAEELEADKKAAEEIEAKTKEDEKAKADKEAEKAAKADKKEGDEETEVDTSENDPEKLKKTIERLQKRVDKITAQSKTTKAEKEELATKLAQIQEGKEALLTEEDVETRSEKKANEKVAQREFVTACNRLADGAEKVDKKFPEKVKLMGEELGPIPGQMIGILDDMEDGSTILNYLTDNIEDAERIYTLTPAKMALELTKLSTKIEKEAETKAKAEKDKNKKEISKVPPHSEPPGGSSKTDEVLRDNDPMDDWIKKRNRQAEEHRKLKYAR